MNDSKALERTVMTGTPQEAASFFRMYRADIKNAGRTLGLACRFRGLEYVKALVENDAAFDNSEWNDYWLAPLEVREKYLVADLFRDNCFCADDSVFRYSANGADKTFKPLPIEQRARIVQYLCENSERANFDPDEMLLYSIMSNNKKITAVLKEAGAAFSEERIKSITENNYGSEHRRMRRPFLIMLSLLDYDDVFEVVRNIIQEIGGERIFCGELIHIGRHAPWSLYYTMEDRFFEPEFFRFFFENFKIYRYEKEELVKEAVLKNKPERLALCAERGWLNEPHKRDETIALAMENKSMECVAWLLDFKNRNFDLAAERAKAEKKARHELNVAPDSPTALANIWSWKKQTDGTLVITDYKGTYKEVVVPSRIGKRAVTAIGGMAFSMVGSGDIRRNRNNPRYTMSRIVLPDGIRRIGARAFWRCMRLEELIIPDDAEEIGAQAFMSCKALKKVVIPASVKLIGDDVFLNCEKVTVIAEPGSFAEEYCKENNIPFKYGSDA